MQQTLDRPVGGSRFEEVFKSIVEHAGATLVYGEPIVMEGKTILPVARVRYGFGGGGGRSSPDQEGGGGGGGLVGSPLGVVEITPSQTRFIPISPGRTVAAAVAFGFLLGRLTSHARK